ncbi:MAG: hypothetical protein ACP5N9_01195 [Candidatus Bilamarchaeum sp.]|jgi:hypothetical protein
MVVQILEVLATLAFLAAFMFSVKLYFETDRKWYWICFCLSAFSFAITHVVRILWPFNVANLEFLSFIQETGEIVGGMFFSIACYGIYYGMKKIREKLAT